MTDEHVVHEEVVSEPVVHPEQAQTTTVLEPVETVPAVPEKIKGTNTAGLQRIQAAITLLKSHSAASVGNSIIGEAVTLLEQGNAIFVENDLK